MIRAAALIALSAVWSSAEEESAGKHQLRIFPVGDPPPFVQELRDGARYEVAPPEGTVPPRFVSIGAADDAETGAASGPSVRLRLGRPSEPLVFPTPESGRAAVGSEANARWLEVPLQPCGRTLAMVCRGESDWKSARAVVIPDDAEARKEGRVHFANLSGTPLAIVYGTEKIRLNPGKTFHRTLSDGGPVPLQVFCPSAGGSAVLCHSSSLEKQAGLLTRVVMFKADGGRRRTPVKVLQISEPCARPQAVTRAGS